MHPARIVLMVVLFGVSSVGRAETPVLTGSSPLGVQRGQEVEVAFQGARLKERPRLIAPFQFQIEESSGSESEETRWTVRLTVDPRTPVGVYPIRIVTDLGPSNPLLFAVGQVGQVSEVEPNNSVAAAQTIPNPAVVEGECPGNDRDFFRFEGRQGDRVVVDALGARIGTEVDPMIRLSTTSGRLIASADDTPGLTTDAYLAAVLPEDGFYIVEFCDSRFAGAGRTAYRLTIGEVPFAGEIHPFTAPRGQNTAFELRGGTLSVDGLIALRTPSDPLLAMFHPAIPARLIGDPAWADSDLDVESPAPVPLDSSVAVLESTDPQKGLPPLSPPVTIVGRLSSVGEKDEYTISAPAGSRHEVRVEASELGSALDGRLRILDGTGRLLGESDDGKPTGGRRRGGGGGGSPQPPSTDPGFDLTIPEGEKPGEVKLVVTDLMDRGGVGFTYRLVVEPTAPSFDLALDDWQVAIPRGGLVLIPVKTTRSGYDGAVTLDVQGIPPDSGVTVVPTSIPPGRSQGLIALKSDGEAEHEPQAWGLQVMGHGEDGRSVAASGTIIFARQTMTVPGFGMSGTIPSYMRPVSALTAAPARPNLIRLNADADALIVPQGGAAETTLTVEWTSEARKAFKLVPIALPDGLTVAETQVGEASSTVNVHVSATKEAVVGPVLLGLVARENEAAPPDASALITVEIAPAP